MAKKGGIKRPKAPRIGPRIRTTKSGTPRPKIRTR